MDGGLAAGFHELHMMFPVEVLVDKGAEVSNGGLGDIDMLRAMYWVDVSYAGDGRSNEGEVGFVMGECHKFAFIQVGSESVAEEPLEDLCVALGDGVCRASDGCRSRIDHAIIHVKGEVIEAPQSGHFQEVGCVHHR